MLSPSTPRVVAYLTLVAALESTATGQWTRRCAGRQVGDATADAGDCCVPFYTRHCTSLGARELARKKSIRKRKGSGTEEGTRRGLLAVAGLGEQAPKAPLCA